MFKSKWFETIRRFYAFTFTFVEGMACIGLCQHQESYVAQLLVLLRSICLTANQETCPGYILLSKGAAEPLHQPHLAGSYSM